MCVCVHAVCTPCKIAEVLAVSCEGGSLLLLPLLKFCDSASPRGDWRVVLVWRVLSHTHTLTNTAVPRGRCDSFQNATNQKAKNINQTKTVEARLFVQLTDRPPVARVIINLQRCIKCNTIAARAPACVVHVCVSVCLLTDFTPFLFVRVRL